MQHCVQDSFFSWVVAISCLWIYGVIYGLVRLSGVMLVASIPRYNVGREAASFPYTLVNFTKNLAGVLVGLLANRFGVRPVMMIAIVIAATGVAGCFLADNIVTVAVLWGLLFGTGASCVSLLPALINYNFNKYRSIASGLSKCGVCLGSFIMPLIADALLKKYELSGTFLILSGLVLNCLPAALFLKCPNFVAKELKPVTDPSCDVVYSNRERQPLISKKTALYKNIYNSMSADRVFPFMNAESSQRYQNVGISKDFHHRKSSVLIARNSSGSCKETFTTSLDSHKALDRSEDQVPCTNIEFSAQNSNETDRKTYKEINNGTQCASIDSSEPITMKIDRRSDETSYLSPKLHHNNDGNDCNNGKIGKCSDMNGKSQIVEKSVCKADMNGTKEPKYQDSSVESVHLACDPLFMLSLFAAPFATFISTSMYAIVVDFSQDVGVSPENGKYTVMAISGGEIVGHLVIGLLTDGWLLSNTTFLVGCCATQAAVVVAVAWSTGFSSLVVSLFLFGFIVSGFSVIVPLVLGDFIEHEKQMLAIASNALLAGPATLAITPLIGYFRDDIGSYEYFFYVISICSLLCGILWLAVHFVSKRRKKYRFLI